MQETPTRVPEFTFKAVLSGLVFGVMFGVANAYLGLKAGLTVSTSIPIAVLSVMVFRMMRSGTALEANMAQTVGSASSSLASGTIFTIPALFMWGLVPTTTQVAALAFSGAVLGIMAMIPLRRLLLVQSAGTLPYPEGRACAEVIRTSIGGAGGARWIVMGLLLGALIKVAASFLELAPEKLA
jgi:putative OPT family oligopeptide transporter